MKGPGWPDARGWIGLGSYGLVVLVLVLVWVDRTLLNNDFFKVIATAIVLTGWNGGPLSWAYAATKSGGELADRNATIVEQQSRAPTGRVGDPLSVTEDGKGMAQ